MTKKYFKLLLCLGVILCIFCTSFTVITGATWGDFSGEVETDSFEDDTKTETETQETTTEEPTTQAPTTTEKTTLAPSTTKAETKPATTVSGTVKDTTKGTTKPKTTKESSETETAPEGKFTVYLESNNGEARRRFDLEKPGLVPEPAEPVRPGYIFEGWYKNAECTIPWDFNKDIADRGTVIYVKWEKDANTIAYNITVLEVPGGTIEVNPSLASKGEPIMITVHPDDGKRLVAGSITINGENIPVMSFIMRGEDVVVGAAFEDIPEEIIEEKAFPFILVIIGVVVLLAVVIAIIIIVRYKTRPAVVEYDENGAIILDDDDYDGWVDESIIIEDGFANGKIVRESVDSDTAIYEAEKIDEYDSERTD